MHRRAEIESVLTVPKRGQLEFGVRSNQSSHDFFECICLEYSRISDYLIVEELCCVWGSDFMLKL